MRLIQVLLGKGKTLLPVRTLVAVAALVLVAGLAVLVLTELDRQLDHHREAQSDNRVWNLAQVEVDLQRLQISMLTARLAGSNEAALSRVRRDFDLLHSRVSLVGLRRSASDLHLRESESWLRLQELMDQMARLIDHSPDRLPLALGDLTARTATLLPSLRQSVTEALQVAAGVSDTARADLRRALRVFSGALLGTTVVLALAAVTIHLQGRTLARRAHKLEHALRSQRMMIEASQDGVLVIANDGRIIVANAVTEALLGPSGRRRHITDHLRPEIAALTSCTRRQSFIRRSDGTEVPVEVTMLGTLSPEGRSFRVAFLRDMSDQIAREGRLARALAAAQQGEKAKARFVAIMSHEMRTPLAGLLSAIDLMEATKLDPDQADLIRIMGDCGRLTLDQVNNVLDLTHLATPGTGFPCMEFDLRGLLQAQILPFQAAALQRGTALTLEAGPGSRVRIDAALQLVERVGNALLSNAVKFTEGGRIVVSCFTTPAEAPGKMTCTIIVEDSGIGIQPRDLKRMFHSFETLDNSYSRLRDGAGLGLGIARLAAEALGGRIAVDSTPGQGSRFAFSFPADLARPESAAPLPLCPSAPLRILLAEDNAINRQLLVRQLERRGHEVIAVANGADAVEEVQLDEPFDLVLMDISMPKMDGITATRILRDQGDGRPLPIVALTAHADPSRHAEFRAAGMDEVITKPVDMARLLQIAARLVGRSSGSAPEGLRPDPKPQHPATLLDDMVTNDLIQSLGHDFLIATLHQFDAELTAALPRLFQAQEAGKTETLADLAHRQAGASAMLGFAALAAALRRIETRARTGVASDTPDLDLKDLGELHAAGMAEMMHQLDQSRLDPGHDL